LNLALPFYAPAKGFSGFCPADAKTEQNITINKATLGKFLRELADIILPNLDI
jgi:hypothetical protein